MSNPIITNESGVDVVVKYLESKDADSNILELMRKEKIRGGAFLSLTEADLKEFKLTFGDRKWILAQVQKVAGQTTGTFANDFVILFLCVSISPRPPPMLLVCCCVSW